jgi:hypothetical protein
MLPLRQASATLVVALVVATSVLPLAAHAERRGCQCAVKMACCEDGTCTMGGDDPPATGLDCRSCQREAPTATTSIDAFERALMQASPEAVEPDARPLARVASDPVRARIPSPSTPPPRLFSF